MKAIVSSQIRQAVLGIINEHTRARSRHKVGVTSDVARTIHPREYLIEKTLDLLVRAFSPEFRDPDWTALGDLASILDVLLEVGGVIGAVVPII